ncbi:NUDIX domain-containing protein [Saccharopolyspora rhizosphaerae]|uniref:NUDIX domain-containing protein n=2 Tax=Saccharopolyspora rhizosphaerae TaxID=2492662 RepID=A0A426JYY9_9PSEU|nr:NUDIX domain-containing protein [Saccharopolyspora rhizosphaerae]
MRERGLWHAAAVVFLLSGDGERVYVHRRTDTKDVYPGLHDCAAGGVVAAGEAPRDAARRELAEELGVRTAPEFLFRQVFEEDTVRYHGFVFQARWDGPVVHQPEEVAEGWWMPLPELRRRLDDPLWPFVPDGRAFARRWLQDHAPGPAQPRERPSPHQP